MARLLQPLPRRVRRLGVLPSAFNPVTVAHLALADAAARAGRLDAVIFALPAALPHKTFHGATFEDRQAMLELCLERLPDRVPAVAETGLMHEIVEEVREAADAHAELCLICGRDAAERIVGWDYGSGPSFGEQLERFELLVAAREGPFRPPEGVGERVCCFELEGDHHAVSSSALRAALAAGGAWERLTSPPVVDLIRRRGLYRRRETAAGA